MAHLSFLDRPRQINDMSAPEIHNDPHPDIIVARVTRLSQETNDRLPCSKERQGGPREALGMELVASGRDADTAYYSMRSLCYRRLLRQDRGSNL